MNSPARPEELIALLFVSVIFLATIVFFFWLLRALELKLVTLGVVTGLLAVWCGQLTSGGERVVIVSQAAAALGRIAFVLVLGGVAVGVLDRCAAPSVPSSPEETSRGNPV
jgi:peptidoglycan/LPS O-acetylase OafA/YrhL